MKNLLSTLLNNPNSSSYTTYIPDLFMIMYEDDPVWVHTAKIVPLHSTRYFKRAPYDTKYGVRITLSMVQITYVCFSN